MKHYIVVLIFIFIFVTNLHGQWTILNEGDVFTEIEFVNEDVGWLVGESTILKTNDGGETWQSIPFEELDEISDIDFVNDSIGWVLGNSWDESAEMNRTKIFKSGDGGKTWTLQKEFIETGLTIICAINDSLVYVVGDFWIFKTSDSGKNWTTLPTGWNKGYFGPLWYINNGTLIGSTWYDNSDATFVLKTIDDGKNWEEWELSGFTGILDLEVFNDSTACFLAFSGDSDDREYLFCKTTDTLNTYIVNYRTDSQSRIQCYFALSPDTIFAVIGDSLSTNVIKSENGGRTWEKKQTLWWMAENIYFITQNIGFMLEIYPRRSTMNLYKSIDQGDTWILQNFLYSLTDLYFVNKDIGFAATGQIWWGRGHSDPIGNLLFTNNGGETWHHSFSHPADYVSSCLFLNDHVGFTVATDMAWRGYIYKSVDSGNNWSTVYEDNLDSTGYNFNGNDINFIDEETGWAVGKGSWAGDSSGALILGTSNGGENWDPVWKYPDTDTYIYNLNSLYVIGSKAWGVGESGLIVNYTKQNQWQVKPSITDLPLNDVFFTDENHGWITGGYIDEDNVNLKIFKTINGGENWLQLPDIDYQINDIYFENKLHGWAVGNDTSYYGEWWNTSDSGIILETIDGGESWTVQVNNLIAPLNAIQFKDGYGWAVGDFGLVLKTDDGANWVDQNAGNTFPDKFSLSQNYPNPFNPRTIINYQLPMTNDVNLSIYNLLGQKVVALVNEQKRAGSHQVEWDAGQLSSGVYYYRIEAGEFQDVKKMVLLR